MFDKKLNFPNFSKMKSEGIKAYETSKTLKGEVGIKDGEPPELMIGGENLSDLLTDIAITCYAKQIKVEIKVKITL